MTCWVLKLLPQFLLFVFKPGQPIQVFPGNHGGSDMTTRIQK